MKVRKTTPIVRLVASMTVMLALAGATLAAPATAPAIDRKQVMKRASTWIRHKVPYSQNRYHKGYRQDCSGFVSMAWGLGRSYTSRTISSRATRIPVSQLRPGDAVWKRGHVSIFGGWKNKSKRQYWAYEQTTWGSHAKKHVRAFPRGGKALRLKGIRSAPRLVAKAKAPAKPASPPAAVATAPDPAQTEAGAVAAAAIVRALTADDPVTPIASMSARASLR